MGGVILRGLADQQPGQFVFGRVMGSNGHQRLVQTVAAHGLGLIGDDLKSLQAVQIGNKLVQRVLFRLALQLGVDLPVGFSVAVRIGQKKPLAVPTFDLNPGDRLLGKPCNRFVPEIVGGFIQITKDPVSDQIQGFETFTFDMSLSGALIGCFFSPDQQAEGPPPLRHPRPGSA